VLLDLDGTLVDFVGPDVPSLRWPHSDLELSIPFDHFLDVAVQEIMAFHALEEEEGADPLRMHEFQLKNTLAQYDVAWDPRVADLYQQKLIELCEPFAGVTDLLSSVSRTVKTGLVTNAYDGEE